MPISKYGIKWPDGYNDLLIELLCFREDSCKWNIPAEQRAFHFKNVCRMLWGPKSAKPFIWNPWADKMLKAALTEKYAALAGCASSGKTSFSAIWGLVNWLAKPDKTLVLLTSTSLEDARRRIWGEIEAYFNAANDSLGKIQKGAKLPGRLLGATGKIRTQDGDEKFDDKCGIQLVSGDRAKEKENIGKLIGLKNERVFLLADELPELSPALIEAAKGNLITNPFFQMVASGNFASIYDPFGMFSEPAGGWGSVTPDCDEWRMKDGLCLRFDGLKSPNILLGEQRYPGMYSAKHLQEHRATFGEHSALFWRMCRSYPCPEADADRVYSEADLLKGDVRSMVKWQSIPVKCAALDPAFATGGDKAMAYFGLLGASIDGKQVLQIQERKELREDIRKKDENRALQITKLYVQECKDRQIAPENAAYDGSGGGMVIGSLLTELWSPKPLGVQFGGAASERPASVKDRRMAKEAFTNRVSEIWFAGVDFVQSGQIKGLPAQCCVELTERRRKMPTKAASGIKYCVESKADMKQRTGGKSPDDADCFLILLELCRVRLNFRATGMGNAAVNIKATWKQKVSAVNRIYRNANYEREEVAA